MKSGLLYCLIFLWGFIIYAQENTVWLDELNLSTMTSGWGSPKKNQSVLGYPIQMSNKKYARGVGVHAESKYILRLNGQATQFLTTVGVDDTGKEESSVKFYMLGDQKILWESGLLKKGDYKEVKIDLRGIELFAIYISDGGDGYNRDYANLAQARFKTKATIQHFIPEKHRCEIFPPEFPNKPKINGPKVIGVRSKAPILHRLPVSGTGPISYSIGTLPKDLKFNKKTGVFSGFLREDGVYTVKISVSNGFGSDHTEIDFVVGNTISLTPPMGWNSWNVWGANIDQEKIRDAGEALVSSGLADYGWSYIVIDDGWQGVRMSESKALQPNKKFEHIKDLINDVHEMGLKFGLYSTPWITSFAGYCGTSSDSIDGFWDENIHGSRAYTKMGKYSFESQDVTQFVDWGIDYLKYDWNPIDREALKRMGKQIKNASRDIVFSISNTGKLMDAEVYRQWANLWRTTSDIRDEWDFGHASGKNAQGIMDIYRYHPKWSNFSSPGRWNDPDMLVLGDVGWGNPRPNRLNCNELYTHFTLWCIWSAPLMLGCDLNNLDPLVKSIVTNAEVIEINQDKLGIQGELVLEKDGISIFKKALSDGSWAIAVLNRGKFSDTVVDRFDWGYQPKRKVIVTLDQLDLKGAYEVRDLWRHENMGIKNKDITLYIPHHGVSLLKLKAVK